MSDTKPTIERTMKNIQSATDMDIYKCSECLVHKPSHNWLTNDGTGELCCGDCGVKVKFSHRSSAAWISIAAYYVAREYGGPEEGGWWYDSEYREDCTVRCFEANDLEDAAKYVHKLRNEWVDNKGPGCARYAIRMFSNQLPVKHAPENRPVYS